MMCRLSLQSIFIPACRSMQRRVFCAPQDFRFIGPTWLRYFKTQTDRPTGMASQQASTNLLANFHSTAPFPSCYYRTTQASTRI